METKKKTGWAYIRVSNSASQAQILHGSLEQQENRIRRWVIEKSQQTGILYQVTRYISEDVSGQAKYLSRRTEYHELIRAIETKKIDFVVVEKLDRMHRDQIELLKFIRLCEQNGVEFERLDGGIVDWRDRGSRLAANVEIMMAHEYVIDLMEKKSKKNREARVNNGKDTSTMPILGLDPHPTDACFYFINKEEQKQIIDIFEYFCTCVNLHATVKYCNKMGYRTKVRKTKETVKKGKIVPSQQVGGNLFDSRRLETLLTSSKLAGYGHFFDDWNQFPHLQDDNKMVRFEYRHGPVVPTELFLRVNQLLREKKDLCQRTGNERRIYPLHGIFFAKDGTKFVGESGTARSGELYYYYVNRSLKIRLSAVKMEKIVVDYLQNLCSTNQAWSHLIETTLKERNHKIMAIDGALERKRNEIYGFESEIQVMRIAWQKLAQSGHLDQASELLIQQLDNKTETENKIKILKEEIEELEVKKKELQEIEKQSVVQKNIRALWAKIASADSAKAKRIIQSIIKRMTYSPDEKQLSFYLNPNLDCHTEEKMVRLRGKWRERRDLNPRPPA